MQPLPAASAPRNAHQADAGDQSVTPDLFDSIAEADFFGSPETLENDEGYADLFDTLPEDWNPPPEVEVTSDDAPLTDSVVWLARNYRFGLDSDIGRLSIAIRDGNAQAALNALDIVKHVQDRPGERAAVLHDDANPMLSESVLSRLSRGFAPYAEALSSLLEGYTQNEAELFDALNRFRVLCATRKGPRGVDEVNARIAAKVRERAGIAIAFGAQWFAGRPVIITRNDYALGLFNGDIGIALPGVEGALRVAFRMADGSLRYVSPAALPPHDTVFALTVHKSQGSEFEHAALVLPGTFARELIYTAITRAKRRVDVFGSAEILAQAVVAPTRRDSGLAARMHRLSAMHASVR
ncbi:Exodeoxyribonuclease V alpha chain [Candidatus Burkholderia humilis]|nr:Exodeoxyribonuclease V alpha chain [Candidatus Burkholderia humilis]